MKSLIKGEPIAVVAALVTAYHQGVAAALVFDLIHWSAKQVITAEAFIAAVLAIPLTLLVRNAVTPNSSLPSGD